MELTQQFLQELYEGIKNESQTVNYDDVEQRLENWIYLPNRTRKYTAIWKNADLK